MPGWFGFFGVQGVRLCGPRGLKRLRGREGRRRSGARAAAFRRPWHASNAAPIPAWRSVHGREEMAVDGLLRTLRLVLGVGMVAAGTALAAPAGMQFHEWWQGFSRPPLPAIPVAVMPPLPAGAVAEALPQDYFPDGRSGSGSTAGLDRDYVMPPPPAPLPPVGAIPLQAGAALATAYRSTLEVPPPPLLDGQQPPPLAASWGASRQPDRPGPRPVAQPSAAVYLIRDGDDLTGIAMRLYGNPAAAAVIWQANRGLLRDPGILPIGATILLPNPELVTGLTQAGPRSSSIEPASSPTNVRAVGQTWP